MTERKLRVAVVFGGRDTEHADSCRSAGSVLSQLDTDRFDVVPVGITVAGGWVLESTGPKALPAAADADVAVPERVGTVLGQVDVVFPVLHGTYGEDGTIQGLLELAGVPYAGAGVLATAAAIDGEFSRKLLAAEGLPIGPFVVLRRGVPTVAQDARERLGLPVFVAPARGGGGTRVTDWADLDGAIETARLADQKVVVSAAPHGREIQCGVLEYPDGRVDSSLPAEIHGNEFRGTDNADDDNEFDIPAKLPDDVIERVRELAVRAFRALNCQGLARVDFRIGPDDVVTVHQLNTMPGFDAGSSYPRMWAVTGVDGPTLLTTLVETAVARGTGLR
ncbi:MAG TPA: D-alanine--D-alanine ligase family protein [Pseudonocardiaceae bacterium]|jgi:D-alanine-D-alanine ligase|nr:D-alanine--D-alanine ligase family protein [Pseudonocardiaceae bacterium]